MCGVVSKSRKSMSQCALRDGVGSAAGRQPLLIVIARRNAPRVPGFAGAGLRCSVVCAGCLPGHFPARYVQRDPARARRTALCPTTRARPLPRSVAGRAFPSRLLVAVSVSETVRCCNGGPCQAGGTDYLDASQRQRLAVADALPGFDGAEQAALQPFQWHRRCDARARSRVSRTRHGDFAPQPCGAGGYRKAINRVGLFHQRKECI